VATGGRDEEHRGPAGHLDEVESWSLMVLLDGLSTVDWSSSSVIDDQNTLLDFDTLISSERCPF
jgi:hypothetical protein